MSASTRPLKVALMTTKQGAIFNPTFTITPAVASGLMRIEAVKQAIQTLPGDSAEGER